MAKKTKAKNTLKKTISKIGKTTQTTKKNIKKGMAKMGKAKTAKSKKSTLKKAAKTVAKKVIAKVKAVKEKIIVSPQTPSIPLGAHVPNFEIPATGGKRVSLESLKGKNVVLYFYPKDATPGCTIEGHEFTKLYPEFAKENTEVFGISRDDLSSHEKFKSKEGYCFDLLSDEKGELSEAFGVWKEKNNYGKKYMGIERSTFLIDANGILKHEWRRVKVDGHAQEVLETVKTK